MGSVAHGRCPAHGADREEKRVELGGFEPPASWVRCKLTLRDPPSYFPFQSGVAVGSRRRPTPGVRRYTCGYASIRAHIAFSAQSGGRSVQTADSGCCSARRQPSSEGPPPPKGSHRPRSKTRPSADSPDTTRPSASRRGSGGDRSWHRAPPDRCSGPGVEGGRQQLAAGSTRGTVVEECLNPALLPRERPAIA